MVPFKTRVCVGGVSSFPSYFVIQRKKSQVKKIKGTEHCGFKLMFYNCFIIIKLEGRGR